MALEKKLSLCIIFLVIFGQIWFDTGSFIGIEGNFCIDYFGRKTCCKGRMDDCAYPIQGTLCYCDDFCNRTEADDCCPDYLEACHDIITPKPEPKPLIGCYHKGQYYGRNENYTDNCNTCTCTITEFGSQMLCEDDVCIIDNDLLTSLNKAGVSWKAANYSQFWGKKLKDGMVYKTGTLEPELSVKRMFPVFLIYDVNEIPRKFDSRIAWKKSFHPVRNQGWCGSSWAISTASVVSDRLAIQSMEDEIVELSPQNLLSCNTYGQKGCMGGYVDRAWNYIRKYGIVDEDCYPYTSGMSSKIDECQYPKYRVMWQKNCSRNKLVRNHLREKYRTQPAYRIDAKESDIQYEIKKSGPVQAIMKVSRDFFMYKEGIYKSFVPQDDLNINSHYHSIKLIGWGEDFVNGEYIKYWLAANSWGADWGENGMFRIQRGINEANIESFVISAWADAIPPDYSQ